MSLLVSNSGQAGDSQAAPIGTGEIFAVPSRTDAKRVYGVIVVTSLGTPAYWCSCVARRECWHIREVQRSRQEGGSHLKLVAPAPLDFSADEPWDFANNCPIGSDS